MPAEYEHLQARIARLEEILYFQENTIKELNEALTQQQFQMDTVEKRLYAALQKLDDVQAMVDHAGGGAEQTVPPHSVQQSF